MPLDLRPPGPLRVVLLLVRRELIAKLTSPWFYAVATSVCLLAWIYGGGFLRTFETEAVMVTTDPLFGLNVAVVVLVGLVLGLRLASSVAWEREHRTFEVLVVGPATPELVVVAKFLVEACVFTALIGIYALYLVLAQPLGSGVIGWADALSAGWMPLHALPLLALGLLVSAFARTVRGAVIAYLASVVVLCLIEIALGLLRAQPPEALSLGATYLRASLERVGAVLEPVSAVAKLADLIDGLVAQAPVTLAQTGLALLLTAATLGAAAFTARIRGAIQ